MIHPDAISDVIEKYDLKNIHMAVIGSHSALEIMDGAKDEGLRTVSFVRKEGNYHM